jgi:hypothetical protein
MTEFEKFYEAWLRKLDQIQIPADQLTGGETAAESVSWDRKAAWMFFQLMKAKQHG